MKTTTAKRTGGSLSSHRPPLRLLLSELRTQAERTGEDRALTLSKGARVAWRVRVGAYSNTPVLTFAVSRQGVRVGDTEIEVFKAQAGVLSGAVRVPAEGQMPIAVGDETWFRIAWRWTE